MKLVYYPNKILQQVCTTIVDPAAFIELSAKMHSIMKENNGVGLAAPQVGKTVRLIVINTMHTPNGKKLTMINPEIISSCEDRAAKIEGCLSFPGVMKYINRPLSVKVKHTTVNGKEVTEEYTGLTAQAIQHEIDHLNGIVFTDERAGT